MLEAEFPEGGQGNGVRGALIGTEFVNRDNLRPVVRKPGDVTPIKSERGKLIWVTMQMVEER